MTEGRIVRLQVQCGSLKIRGGSRSCYAPEPLCAVNSLEVGPGGVIGLAGDGPAIMDVHHSDHTASKNRTGANGVSIGFLSHYELMRKHFGGHMVDGIAGENILVDAGRSFVGADLPEHIAIETMSRQVIPLYGIQVAEPCVEFTRFAPRLDQDSPNDSAVADALGFLRNGMRGYYARCGGSPVQLSLGDRLQWTS